MQLVGRNLKIFSWRMISGTFRLEMLKKLYSYSCCISNGQFDIFIFVDCYQSMMDFINHSTGLFSFPPGFPIQF